MINQRVFTRKMHPEKYSIAREKTFAKIVVINAMVRDGATLREVAKLLGTSITLTRNRYYGIADNSVTIDDNGYFRIHIGAHCDLEYEVDYENLETYRPQYTEFYRKALETKARFKTFRQSQKRAKTLRELLAENML